MKNNYLDRACTRPCHREEIYREETRGKLCHADIFSRLLTIENYINSLFYYILMMQRNKTIQIIEVFMFFYARVIF